MNEEHYIRLLAAQLKGFKKTASSYNFKCPLCGDSKRNKSKQRGYLYSRNGEWFFHCHNGCPGRHFKWFLKHINPVLYQDYVLDNFNRLDSKEKPEPIKKAVPVAEQFFKKLPKISSLSPLHPVKQFIVARQIPTDFHHQLFFCKTFKAFTNQLIPDKFEEGLKDESRIVIPITRNGNIVGFQGRAIGKSDAKYITIVLDEEFSPLIFNYDNVNWNEKHYIFEGVFDSIFVPNSLAVCGSGLLRAVQRLNKPKNNSVLCFDNEPRNVANIDQMKKAVLSGFRICVMPDTHKFKDVNDYVLSVVGKQEFVQTERIKALGHEIKRLIDKNTYYGLNAELKLAEWSKV